MPAERGGRPNIVFVLTDDQGYGDLGCHGNPYIRTPHIDALHRESVRLTNYHVGPTCSPTRAGLVTGHYANSTGVWHTIGGRSLLRLGERTLAERLAAAGYATALFGKWHLGDAYPYRPEDRGFQEVVTHGGGGVGNTPDYWGNNYTDDTYRHNSVWERYEGYCTDVWFRLAGEFIERQAPDQPFFCLVSTNAPHTPHIVPEQYVQPYRDLVARDVEAARFFGAAQSDQMLRFYGMVTCIDERVGALREHLAALGLAEHTIFIFMTDNGSAGGLVTDAERFVRHGYNAGMRGGKSTPYEGGHRVPFFLHWPGGGLAQGRDVATLTANVDIAPTLLELCAVPADVTEFHGRTLAPLLGAGDVPGAGDGGARGGVWPERAVVTDSQRLLHPVKWRLSCVMRQEVAPGGEGGAAATRHEWRLINGRALYDLVDDPEQRHDVAGAWPQVVARLRDDYEAWWALVSPRVGEEIPIPVGGDAPQPVLLTAHDWRRDVSMEVAVGPEEYGDDARCVWNQAQVRQGPQQTGYWELEVRAPATYRFELRRWPREAGLAMDAGIAGELKRYDHTIGADHGGYGGGRAIAVRQAGIRISGQEQTASVPPGAAAAVFELPLAAGPAHLETWMRADSSDTPDGASDAGAGELLSAYYVYVEPAPVG